MEFIWYILKLDADLADLKISMPFSFICSEIGKVLDILNDLMGWHVIWIALQAKF